MSGRAWTAAELRTLRRYYPHERAQDVAARLGRSISSVHQRALMLGLRKSEAFKASDKSGRIVRGRQHPSMILHQFAKGHDPWNKGTHWHAGGRSVETQFQRGHMAGAARAKYKPVGTTRIVYGNLERKITDDPEVVPARRWVPVHRMVWEAANGPTPRGHVVVFRQGLHTTDERNITLERLELISRAENMRRNSYMTRYPKEVADLIRARGHLNRKIHNREKQYEQHP